MARLNFFLDRPTGFKIGAGITVMVVLAGLIGTASLQGVEELARTVDRSSGATGILVKINSAVQDVNRFLVENDPGAITSALSNLNEADGDLSATGSADTATVENLKTTVKGFSGAVSSLDGAAKTISDARTSQADLFARVMDAASKSQADAEQAWKDAVASASAAQTEAGAVQNMIGAVGVITANTARSQLMLENAVKGNAKLIMQAKMTASTLKGQIALLQKDGPDTIKAAADDMQATLDKVTAAFAALPADPLAGLAPGGRVAALDAISADIETIAGSNAKLGFSLKKALDEANLAAKRSTFAADQARENAAVGQQLAERALELKGDVAAFELTRSDKDEAQVRATLDAAGALVKKLTGAGAKNVADDLAAYHESFANMVTAIRSFDQAVASARTFASQTATAIGSMIADQASIASLQKSRSWNVVVLVTVVIILAAVGIGFLLTRSIARPIAFITDAMLRLSGGATDIVLQGKTRNDEIGKMFDAVGVFRDNAVERMRLLERTGAEERRQTARAERVQSLIATFRQRSEMLVRTVNRTADDLQSTARQLTDVAASAAEQATAATAATDNSLQGVTTVASSAEELSASIGEIGRQVSSASTVVTNASTSAATMNTRIVELSQCAGEIGTVVGLIKAIADQTNLLALNATIEAARAGEAGKGFAVVAGEVKSLASQTARATDEIAKQIEAIQRVTDQTADAVRDIVERMRSADQATAAIASSVVEQEAATAEISRSVQVAAHNSEGASRATSSLMSEVEIAAESARAVLEASRSVIQDSAQLNAAIEEFLTEVAAM
ncbi:methyl-accepting chemotaxis protein [Oryzibacter oryziterrae]|uniref:methyl-accepting chemotaxis protein n=1 Tax=Oryzibacter oryziterrae TaxID=2766474 RepID=UPI001F030FF8|nr:methyl-accepting chemotaxis protein [Oryzibacter oryziterrae]